MDRTAQGFEALSDTRADDPRWQLVQRVAASSHLRGSARLKDFLLYVTECAIREAPQEGTEQQIGIKVFHRSAGYNSSEDSIVRTHARLLRQKLTAYFAEEGADEELFMDIPKGQYLPIFRSALVEPAPVAEISSPVAHALSSRPLSPAHPPGIQPKPNGRKWLFLTLLIPVGLLAWWLWPGSPAGSAELQRLWHPFLTGDPPFVIYSNALFVGDSTVGLRVIPPDSGRIALPGEHLVETYTGVGEVAAIYDITRLFDASHASFILKRSRLVSWDEAKSRNLIFIGAPSQNPALKVLPSTTDFTIVRDGTSWAIANLHPRPGETALYARADYPLTKDYAIVALLPGAEPGKWMMVLSGLTTLGTQAAAEFMCRPASATELLSSSRSSARSDGKIIPFEGVIEVNVSAGVPLQAKLLSLHTR